MRSYEYDLRLNTKKTGAIQRQDLQERLFHHINRLPHGASIHVDWERGVVVLTTTDPVDWARVERLVTAWKEAYDLSEPTVLLPTLAVRFIQAIRPVRHRVVEALDGVLGLEGTPAAASRGELLDILRDLGEAARREVNAPRFVSE